MGTLKPVLGGELFELGQSVDAGGGSSWKVSCTPSSAAAAWLVTAPKLFFEFATGRLRPGGDGAPSRARKVGTNGSHQHHRSQAAGRYETRLAEARSQRRRTMKELHLRGALRSGET